ncbi:8-oxo-dGTP diphosphatase [Gorillibacterium sp. sgz5001074]|uniref:8-oxo-dGTP diphosphatase n=1 Tax=Gorillibacterium sp. sgz5001074 TaxID=3446695 RepID=UPI003F669914
MSKVELTNMCMVYDRARRRVLVQERVKSWKGVAFPGGHVEDGESITGSVIREIREETGLTVSNLEPCGIIHWYNDETGERYMVFNYRTEVYSGELIGETAEGRVFWVDQDELWSLPFAEGFRERVPMFLDRAWNEAYGIWNSQGTGPVSWL